MIFPYHTPKTHWLNMKRFVESHWRRNNPTPSEDMDCNIASLPIVERESISICAVAHMERFVEQQQGHCRRQITGQTACCSIECRADRENTLQRSPPADG
jgi:hypothetical protein